MDSINVAAPITAKKIIKAKEALRNEKKTEMNLLNIKFFTKIGNAFRIPHLGH